MVDFNPDDFRMHLISSDRKIEGACLNQQNKMIQYIHEYILYEHKNNTTKEYLAFLDEITHLIPQYAQDSEIGRLEEQGGIGNRGMKPFYVPYGTPTSSDWIEYNPYLLALGGGYGRGVWVTDPTLRNPFTDISGFLPVRFDWEAFGRYWKARTGELYFNSRYGLAEMWEKLKECNEGDCETPLIEYYHEFIKYQLELSTTNIFSFQESGYERKFLGDDFGWLYLNVSEVVELFKKMGLEMGDFLSESSGYGCDGGKIECICDGGYVPCLECEERGNWTCGDCDGDGMQECWDCDGDGELSCSICDGDGSNKCDSCDEGRQECDECDEGEVDCDICEGMGNNDCGECDEGYNLVNGKKILCEECEGNWELECEACEEGQVVCPHCEGEGIACDVCGEIGEVDCDNCGGDGREDCDECDGDGRSGSCDECGGDGELFCPECDGEGANDCAVCDSDGVLNCIFCDGAEDFDGDGRPIDLTGKRVSSPFSYLFDWKLEKGILRDSVEGNWADEIKWIVKKVEINNLLENQLMEDDSMMTSLNLLSGEYVPIMGYIGNKNHYDYIKNKLINFSVSYDLMTPQGLLEDFVRILYLFDKKTQTFRVFDVQLDWRTQKCVAPDDLDLKKVVVYYTIHPTISLINWQSGFPNIKY